ncbi:MAG: hypothetical protein ISP67_03955 [Flavobacteriaceae bacterium]|nr:hypothetical protein [Flavobacteriaceae bacterium]
MMETSSDTQVRNNIIIAVLLVVIVAILVLFYNLNLNSKAEIDYLTIEKQNLTKSLTEARLDIDRFKSESEFDKMTIQKLENQVAQLQDSVANLSLTVANLKQANQRLKAFERRYDSLRNATKNLIDDRGRRAIQNTQSTAATAASTPKEPLKSKTEAVNTVLNDVNEIEFSGIRTKAYFLASGQPVESTLADQTKIFRTCIDVVAKPTQSRTFTKNLTLRFIPPAGVLDEEGNTPRIMEQKFLVSYDGRGGSICKAVNVANQTIVRGEYTIQVWDKDVVLTQGEVVLN